MVFLLKMTFIVTRCNCLNSYNFFVYTELPYVNDTSSHERMHKKWLERLFIREVRFKRTKQLRMFYLTGSSTSTYAVIQTLLLMVVFRF